MNGIIKLKPENSEALSSAGSSKDAPEEGLTIVEMLALTSNKTQVYENYMQSLNDGPECSR